MGLVMIDITKAALVLYINITNGRDKDMFKVYIMADFELIKSNTFLRIHM